MKGISVVIPVYNKEEYIEECVRSIISQGKIVQRVIVVDDGSTDGSLSICHRIKSIDDRLIIVAQKNKGPISARLKGLSLCDTDYVTFVDADDFIIPNAYDDALEYMRDGIDLIAYEITRYFDGTREKHEYHLLEEGVYDRERIRREVYPKLIWNFEKGTPGIECSQCVRIVKRDILLDSYRRLDDNRFYYGEDWAISIPLLTRIQNMAVIPKSYYRHRQSVNNTAPVYVSSESYFDEIAHLFDFLRQAMSEECSYDFTKQLDYLYMYSVDMKKWAYNDYDFHRDFLFPFDKVPARKRIILYGAGLVGNTYFKQLSKLNYCEDVLWVDRNAEYLNDCAIKPISELDHKTQLFDYCVVAIESTKVANEVREFLISKGFDKEKIVI